MKLCFLCVCHNNIVVRFQVFKITNNDNDGNVPVDNGDNVIAIAIHFNK